MFNNFTVCQKSIGGRFIASSNHLCVTIASKFITIKGEKPRRENTDLQRKENLLIMSLRWSLGFCVWFLLLADCQMDSGDWDDSDIADTLGQRNETNLPATDTITKNASDFHYVARDDHEVIHNLERELRRKSRKRGTKFCWKRCLRSLKCFEQMKNRPKTETGKCAVCVTKCSNITSTQPPNVGR